MESVQTTQDDVSNIKLYHSFVYQLCMYLHYTIRSFVTFECFPQIDDKYPANRKSVCRKIIRHVKEKLKTFGELHLNMFYICWLAWHLNMETVLTKWIVLQRKKAIFYYFFWLFKIGNYSAFLIT